MINKKFSDLFLRKEKAKEEPKKVLEFDQTSFSCKMTSNGVNTELITMQAQLKENGQSLDELKCKWYTKNSRDFKQIEGVNSSYYQPCLDDVGSIICVQMQPFIEGRKYSGITIMEQTEIIELDSKLDSELDNFLQTKNLKLSGRIEAIYSQNQKYEKFELPLEVKVEIDSRRIVFRNEGEILQEIEMTEEYPIIEFIRKTFSSILFNFNQNESMKVSFNNNFNRDLFVLVVRTCVAHFCSQNNSNPEAIENDETNQGKKTESDNSRIESQEKICQEEKEEKNSEQIMEKSPNQKEEDHMEEQKSQEKIEQKVKEKKEQKENSESEKKSTEKERNFSSPVISSAESLGSKEGQEKKEKKSSTMFVLKLDELNKELKCLKSKYKTLEKEYNIEKKGKCSAEIEVEGFKKINETLRRQRDQAVAVARKVRQLKEDNRFYKNEIVVLKRQVKEEKQRSRELTKKIEMKKEQVNEQIEAKIYPIMKEYEQTKHSQQLAVKKAENCEFQVERLREDMEKLENENVKLKRKVQSLANQKGIVKMVKNNEKKEVDKESLEKISELEMKLKNLEMLLRYKSGQSDGNAGLQMLVGKLTETISERQLQVEELRKINKNLLFQLREAKQQMQ